MSDAPIRVLIVEDNPGDARLMREFLTEVPSVRFELTHVERLTDALSVLAEQHFDAVLLDLRLPDSQGIETFNRVHDSAPAVPIVVLTGLYDENLAVKAVEAGAQDYLVKGHVDGETLARSIRYAIVRRSTAAVAQPARSRGRVIAFMGSKGGTGTTSVVLNVAAALARQDKDVIAAEIRECYGTFSAQLGRASVENLSHLLALEPERIDEQELAGRLLGLSFGPRVLFGPQRADEYTEVTAEHASAITEGLARLAGFVLIDLPCCPCPGTRAVAEHSDFVCLVIEKEPSALAAAKVAMDLLNAWGLGADRVGAVLVSRAAYTASSSLREIGSELKCGIIGAVPQATEAFIDALRSGLPLVIQEPESIAATNLTELATRLSADRMVPMSF